MTNSENNNPVPIVPVKNFVRKYRESLLVSKAELARKASLSALTIDRIESGMSCRMDTKRKILLALGLQLSDKEKVFPESEENQNG
ncbi:MAG: XRE family transcriptional regulator [Deltaproteobacteria bacterium]|nr:XRE family transcriptional regulator [Deltaproteobacteria bacterium]